jgi:hypothetical protein
MRFSGLLPLTVATAVGLAACSDSTTPAGPVDLSGSYTLQSIQVSGQTVTNSSGTLQLTGATYDLMLVLNGQVQPEDVGTYLISGTNTWSQNSTTTGVSSIGSFTLVGSTLTITLTAPTPTVAVWTKTGQT